MVKNWVAYIIVLLLTLSFNIFFEGYLSFFVLLIFLFLPVISFILTLIQKRYISVAVYSQDKTYHKGQAVQIKISTSNRLKIFTGKVKICVSVKNNMFGTFSKNTLTMALGAYEQSVILKYICNHCGRHLCSIEKAKIYDFLSLFSFRIKDIKNSECDFYIIPQISEITVNAPSALIDESDSNEYSKTESGDDPSEIFDLREYKEGDRISRINYRLSDKLDTLIIKDFGLPIAQSVLIMVDLCKNIKEADCLVSELCSAINSLLNQEIRCKVRWYNSETAQIAVTELNSKNDFQIFLNQFLSCAKIQDASFVLADFSVQQRSANYTKIFYFCTALTLKNVFSLLESSRDISVYHVVDDPEKSLGGSDILQSIDYNTVCTGTFEQTKNRTENNNIKI